LNALPGLEPQRPFDFECGGVGRFNEYQKWWSDAIDPTEIRIKIKDPDMMICGLADNSCRRRGENAASSADLRKNSA
jgi:hypothetical protein